MTKTSVYDQFPSHGLRRQNRRAVARVQSKVIHKLTLIQLVGVKCYG